MIIFFLPNSLFTSFEQDVNGITPFKVKLLLFSINILVNCLYTQTKVDEVEVLRITTNTTCTV